MMLAWLPAVLLLLIPTAQDKPFHPVKDDPALPRVLLIGDSISIGYTVPVRAALAGKANVHRPRTNCGPTSRGVENIDAWLGDEQWDVIHFNCPGDDRCRTRPPRGHSTPSGGRMPPG